ncbi:hypothetical protein [Altererythrobacter sp. Z27]|uniref:hypothetical protein n=1 Tax=Altererythrobacter sp. Z27 TaxID=3461147 RepID=UPI004044D8F2
MMLGKSLSIGICACICASCATPVDRVVNEADGWLLQRASESDCDLGADDEHWLIRSVEAWRQSVHKIQGVKLPHGLAASFYDGECSATLPQAMTMPVGSSIAARFLGYSGALQLPDGKTPFDAPNGPMSAAFPMDDGTPVFVMSLPSLWRAGGVDSKELGLEALMTAVLLHEAAHVMQFQSYGEQISSAVAGMENSEEIDDDFLQELFGDDPEFAASIASERQLFLAAASAEDDSVARAKVRQALHMMEERDNRYLSGERIELRRVSDLFWTLEGSGQWIGYQWLIAPDGGNFDREIAQSGFGTRGKWWSQSHGFAMARALDRLDPDWPETAFGAGNATLREMLAAAAAD